MKKYILILSCTLLVSLFVSCLKPKHQLRIKNDYPIALKVQVGPNDYGSVGSGSTSSYKSIPEGSHQISGDLVGSVSVTGKGKHNWTMTIGSSGQITIAEDKK